MRRVIGLAIFSLLLITYAFSGYASCDRKVFDPLEPINKTVPPNILVVVDNSGSMAWDTRNFRIFDYRYNRNTYSPAAGDYYHYTLDYQNNSYRLTRVQPYSRFAYSTTATQTAISTGNFQKVGEIFVSDTGKVDYAGFAVDVWVTSWVYNHRNKAQITIKLVHDGVTAEIKPTKQWFAYRYSDGYAGSHDETIINHRTYYRLRIQYAFTNFYGHDKSGTWELYLKTDFTAKPLYFERFGLDFNIYVSKMTALKTVLQRIFAANPEVRFALGTYRAKSGYTILWDANGLRERSRFWYVNSSSPGLSVWEDWPADEMDTQSNRQSLIEWIDLKDVHNDEMYSGHLRKEFFASGYTPIQSCMVDTRSYLSNKYGGDSYQACRNYAVIFLTDGECTQYGCSNETIRDTIAEIYHDHIVQVGTTNRGTKTYVIGLSLNESDRQWLDEWADAGDDGDPSNNSAYAYMPQDSEELMEAFADAVHSASAQEVVINSDVIFGTINPNKAPSGTIFHDTQFTTPSGHVYEGIYPALEANIMFTTKIFYPSWEGDLIAYMPMYRNAADHKLYYFPQNYNANTGTYKPDYPVIWSAREELSKLLDGTDNNGSHVPGIRDALGLTNYQTTQNDDIPWRNIKLVIPAGQYPNFQMINLNQFVYDNTAQKWVPASSLVSTVANSVYAGDSHATEKAVKFIEFVQSRMLGDITYSSPATIYEPEMGLEDWRDSYLKYKVTQRHVRTPIVVVGANDGMLHGFNAYTGEEEWAVIPWGVIDSLREMVNNYDAEDNPSGQVDVTNQDTLGRNLHLYGIASSPKVVDIGTLDDDNPDNDTWETLLICGLGGGGNSYFCLDVTDPLSPAIRWDTSTHAAFSNMGETWAYPSLWLSKKNDTYINVGFFTSGYSTDNSKGKDLYVMDIATGDLITQRTLIYAHNDDFLFAAPAGILNADARFIKGVYIGTTHGEVFRYNFMADDLCQVYETSNHYAIITLPAVYVDSSNNEWISIGELGCADAYSGIFANNAKLYTFKAYPSQSCNGNKNLVDLTNYINHSNFNTVVPLGGNDGYYFGLQLNETMFADPLITTYFYEDTSSGTTQFETVSVFVTYQYPNSGDYCGLGNSYLYILGVTDLFVGTREDGQSDYGSRVSRGRSGSPVRTGVSGTVWINTPDGPLRIMPLDDSVGSASIPVYSPFATNCSDAKKVGAGSWIVY